MRISTERDDVALLSTQSKSANSGDAARGALDRLHASDTSQYRRHAFVAVSIMAVFAGALLLKEEGVAEFIRGHEAEVEAKDFAGGGGVGGWWGNLVDRGKNLWTSTGVGGRGAAKSLPSLLEELRAARGRYDDYLRADYGDFAAGVFNRSSVMMAITRPSNISDVRLKRRMKIKVIEAQLGSSSGGGADAQYDEDDDRPTFTWATGGHSAAAAHGDLLNQSYTAAVARASSIVFGAAGVNFRSKHRAMGGTSSGPEISLCLEAVFGQDIDVLSWDYGMMEGRDFWLYWLWANRAGSHPTFPALFAYDDRRGGIHEQLERNHGQSAYQLSKIQALRTTLPDSNTHPNPASLPPAVAWYMCSGHHENDDVCLDHKWKTNPPCEKVKAQVSWHNGWKDHLFIGSLQATLLVDLLMEAVQELSDRDTTEHPSISEYYLGVLKAEEMRDRMAFTDSALPTTDQGPFGEVTGAEADEIKKSFLRGHPVCHSARLPSDARYLGLVTGSRNKSTHVEHGYHVGYDLGYRDAKSLPSPNPNDPSTPLPLTVREERQECDTPLNHDYKDAFYIRQEDGWMTDVYPTTAEAEVLMAPHPDTEKKGYVVMCLTSCPWGRCREGYTKLEEISPRDNGMGGNVSIVIDGTPVVGSTNLQRDCHLLKGPSGYSFGKGKANGGKKGQYEMKFRVNKPRGMLELSTVVVV